MKKRNSLMLAITIVVFGSGAVVLLRLFPGFFFLKPQVAPLFYWVIGSFTAAATIFVLFLGFSKPSKPPGDVLSYSHWSKGILSNRR